MRKIIYLLGVVLCMAACSDDSVGYVPEQKLEITQSDVDFTAAGGDGTILLSDADTDVEATSDADWCTVTAQSVQGVAFTVAANPSMASRSATISLKSGQASAQVTITQLGFVVEVESKTFFPYEDNAAFSQFIKGAGNATVKATVDAAAASWLQCKASAGGYTVSAGANTGGKARFGKVTLQVGEINTDYYFLQYGKSDLCRDWNVTYTDENGDAVSDVFTVAPVAGDTLSFNFSEGKYLGVLLYRDGALKLPYPQLCPLESAYTLYWGGYAGSAPALERSATYQLKPCLLGKDKWGLSFVDDGSYGSSISALALWAADGNTVVGYAAIFKDVTLSY